MSVICWAEKTQVRTYCHQGCAFADATVVLFSFSSNLSLVLESARPSQVVSRSTTRVFISSPFRVYASPVSWTTAHTSFLDDVDCCWPRCTHSPPARVVTSSRGTPAVSPRGGFYSPYRTSPPQDDCLILMIVFRRRDSFCNVILFSSKLLFCLSATFYCVDCPQSLIRNIL
ncbi:hypothetical protein DFH07DRAFT_501911 [Mycena maculata]|uniref:Uncharacterized protein n=1 Tax=Mycena maculata TaxID=230809 RepID=A0AAD7NBY5_9AGAR|nr:hypothetical protein DFH07DRAFT_501911 [Mycena maculata]